MNRAFLLAAAVVAVAISMPAAAGDAEAGEAKSAPCAGCHGAQGKAMIPTYPHLAGQNAAYLVESMKAYRDNARTGGMAAVMKAPVMALSDEDLADLAAYYSQL